MKSALLGAALAAGTAYAQLSTGEVFLKGNFVEVGVGTLGFYGSNTNAPAGYHTHLTGTSHLGFVCDPGMDGWSVGSPAMMGDYFLPGSPFEGWNLQVDGKRIQAVNNGTTSAFSYSGGMPAATGSNISYTTSGTQVIGTWQGFIDSMIVTQVTTIDAPNLYFTTKITFTNTASTPKNDIYYFRSLDPDNDQTWPGGGFPTKNKITHQMPNVYNVSSVEAVGYSSPSAYLAMGTTHANSRAVIYNMWPIPVSVDLATVYAGTYTTAGVYYDEGTPHNGDIAIGLMAYIPHIASVDSAGDSVLRTTSSSTLHPANTASFTMFHAFSTDAVDSAVEHLTAPPPVVVPLVGITSSTAGQITTTPIAVHTHTAGVSSTNPGEISIYPNPASETLNITGLSINDRYTLYDLAGKAVATGVSSFEGVNTLSLHDLPAGNYIFTATDASGNTKYTHSVSKQ